jgi:hypothetical protein
VAASPPALIVDLRVQADVPPRTVRAAKDAAVAVFRDIGVTVRSTNEDLPDEHGLSLPWRRIAVIDQPTPAYSAAQANDHILAFEIAQLSLPAGHAETGVMRASWSRSDLHGITTRVLAFDLPWAALIRDRLLTERDSRR